MLTQKTDSIYVRRIRMCTILKKFKCVGMHSTETGLTLIELLAVIAILSVVAAVGYSELASTLSGSVLQNTLYSDVISMRMARHDSSITSIPVEVTSSGCQLSYSYSSSPASWTPMALPSSTNTPNSVTCNGGVNGYWLPDGLFVDNLSTLAPTSQTLSFQNSTNDTATFQISAGGMITP